MITQGNLTQAAKLLGIHRTTLYSRMQNYATRSRAAERRTARPNRQGGWALTGRRA